MRSFTPSWNHPPQRSASSSPALHAQPAPDSQITPRMLPSSGHDIGTADAPTSAARLKFDFGRISVYPPNAQPARTPYAADNGQEQVAGDIPSRMLRRSEPELQLAGYLPRRTGQLVQDQAGLTAPSMTTGFLSNLSFAIAGRIPQLGDPIHDPLLDRYSRDTGLPRDTVTQHDPSYEAWLLGRPVTPPPINVVIDMPVPGANPAPDYSRDENRLNAWEKADFNLSVQQSFSCDHVVTGGVESSFVTDVGFRFTQSDFQYFIARHIHENMTDHTLATDVRITWRRIHARIRTHAKEHFTRYRQVVDTMRQDITQRFADLPTRNSQIQIPKADLETYVAALLQYLTAKLHFELWRTTCDWETTDYPNILSGIPSVSGTLTPACGSAPMVPSVPILPIVVTPRTRSVP